MTAVARFAAVFLIAGSAAAPALAKEPLAGDALRAAVSDKTIEGSMTASGKYTEFYAADGVIRGSGYVGKWRIDGDRMCFDYGKDPEACMNVAKTGPDEVEWIENGKSIGTGAVTSGNVNKF